MSDKARCHCGGTMARVEPKRGFGFVMLKCNRDGDNPNCKGTANAGYKKKTGTAEGQPHTPEKPAAGNPANPGKPAGAGAGAGEQPKPKQQRFWDRPILKL